MHFPAFGAKLPNCYTNSTLTPELNWVFWNKAHTAGVPLPTQPRFMTVQPLHPKAKPSYTRGRGSKKPVSGRTRKTCFSIWTNGFKTGKAICCASSAVWRSSAYCYRMLPLHCKPSSGLCFEGKAFDCTLREIYNPHGCRKNSWKRKPTGSKPVN